MTMGHQFQLLAKLNEWGVKHLAVLFVDNEYGQSFQEGLVFMANKWHRTSLHRRRVLMSQNSK